MDADFATSEKDVRSQTYRRKVKNNRRKDFDKTLENPAANKQKKNNRRADHTYRNARRIEDVLTEDDHIEEEHAHFAGDE